MTRAVIYCRCSTEEESQQDALKKQVEEARSAVENHGWFLVQEYVEARSGTSVDKRIQYQKLYADMSKNNFDIVVIKSQDRLMRNTKDWYLFIDRLVTSGKKLYMYLENKFYSTDDSLITGIKAILAEEYSRELSKKINNAHKNRQGKGRSFIIPPQTYGLRKISKYEYVLDEDEADTIRLIFHLARQHGSHVIANILEEEGRVDRHGRYFSGEAVRKIIRNPIRCGTIIQNKRHYDFERKKTVYTPKEEWIIHRNVVPACVTEEEWKLVNDIMDQRAKDKHAESYMPKGYVPCRYDLSGKIKCGYCGNTYYRTHRKRYKNKEYVVDWKCSGYMFRGKEFCDNIILTESVLNKILKELCDQYYKGYEIDSDSIINKTIGLLKTVLDKSDKNNESHKLQNRLKRNQLLQEKLLNKLLSDVITDEVYKKKKSELDREVDELSKKIQMDQQLQETKDAFENRLKSIKYRLETETLEKATVAGMLENIETITVYKDHLEVKFFVDKLLGMDKKVFESGYKILDKLQDGFILEYPLPQDCVYAGKKQMERERVLEYMLQNPYITAREIAEKEGISLSSANYRIKRLRQENKIYFDGKGGKGKWHVNKKT